MTMPIYLDEKQTTETVIKGRMLDKVPSDLDKSEGSYIYDAIAPAANELSSAADMARGILNMTFAQSGEMFGEYLDWRAAEHGVVRKDAAKAVGVLTIEGSAGTIIEKGTMFATPADEQRKLNAVIFSTTERVEISASKTVAVNIEANSAGIGGNVAAKTIVAAVSSISGISNIYNTAPTSGGVGKETDKALLERLLYKVRNPATSGNCNHYREWATEVQGVAKCNVLPLWAGNGTVKLALVDENNKPVPVTVIQRVKDYIIGTNGLGSGKAPIGATVTIIAGIEQPITISIKIILNSGYTLSDAKQQLTVEYTEYLNSLVFAKDNMVRYSKVSDVSLVPAIYDYSDLFVNSAIKNIAIEKDHLAILGSLVVTV